MSFRIVRENSYRIGRGAKNFFSLSADTTKSTRQLNHDDPFSVSVRSTVSTSDRIAVSDRAQIPIQDSVSMSVRSTSVRTSASKLPSAPDKPIVAKKEERAVARAKILVALVMLLSALLVGVGIYMIGVEQDTKNFENLFERSSSEIASVSRQKVEQLFQTLDSFAFSITSQAESELKLSGQRWPFFSIQDWSQKAEKLVNATVSKDPWVILAPIVQEEDRTEWGQYMQQNTLSWVQESISNEGLGGQFTVSGILNRTASFIYQLDAESAYQPTEISRTGESLPVWQLYPFQSQNPATVTYFSMGLDTLSATKMADLYRVSKQVSGPTMDITNLTSVTGATLPASHIMQPIYDTTHPGSKELVAVVIYRASWIGYIEDVLDDDAKGIHIVLRFSCPNDPNKMSISAVRTGGSTTTVVGDVHDRTYEHLEHMETLVDLGIDQAADGVCVPKVTLHLYPTKEYYDSIERIITPTQTASIILAVFGLPAIVFFLYDYLVGRRQIQFINRIALQEMIVSNVFPSAIRDKIYDEGGRRKSGDFDIVTAAESSLDSEEAPPPMAELFPSTTVVFADIAGFTAWASAREPQQVFILLESLYGAFDQIAAENGIFKVETVGDCYVAAAGLPIVEATLDLDHASAACLFANDCVRKMKEMTRRLEVTLGPDTTDLELRVGIHSGQVTAGVLRGERSRFQLFGDTMNTAARMESSGERSRIQLSQATADLLTKAGNSSWFISRGNTIFVKGKGNMQTYWLRKLAVQKSRSRSFDSTEMPAIMESEEQLEPDASSKSVGLSVETSINTADQMTKLERLVEWNVEVLSLLLQQIIASRNGGVKPIDSLAEIEAKVGTGGSTILEEFVPIIPLKRFEERELRKRRRAHTIDIGKEAKSQLRNYLTTIAGMYKDNPFHNFEHASHVTASVKKLLKRIVNTDEGNGLGNSNHSSSFELIDLAGHSYGITSDPLTQFAVVFSAVIHDVDHPGVPNTQLVKEKTRSAQIYKKSIAEQNSVELSWDMLMGREFSALRACIYQTEEELKRFRQLVVNTVMATDVVDKELQALRKSRWDKAFSETSTDEVGDDTKSDDRKATIVIEHLIQASDVSHTMQHWHVYKRWNEKFFQECYGAFVSGRAEVDPSIGWYKGEIGFFDFYVIPLAKKLDSCGVFGVSAHEYLDYAMANREEWVREGENLVQNWKAKYSGDESAPIVC